MGAEEELIQEFERLGLDEVKVHYGERGVDAQGS